MAFELCSEVISTRDVPGKGLRAGDIGTVVERNTTGTADEGYSIEFFDITGNTVAVSSAIFSLARPKIVDTPQPDHDLVRTGNRHVHHSFSLRLQR